MEKQSTGVELIAKERQRQIEVEGYTAQSDAKYDNEELAAAAMCYAAPNDIKLVKRPGEVPLYWPWAERYWKPSPDDRIKELIKAGALAAAQIDNLLKLDNTKQG